MGAQAAASGRRAQPSRAMKSALSGGLARRRIAPGRAIAGVARGSARRAGAERCARFGAADAQSCRLAIVARVRARSTAPPALSHGSSIGGARPDGRTGGAARTHTRRGRLPRGGTGVATGRRRRDQWSARDRRPPRPAARCRMLAADLSTARWREGPARARGAPGGAAEPSFNQAISPGQLHGSDHHSRYGTGRLRHRA